MEKLRTNQFTDADLAQLLDPDHHRRFLWFQSGQDCTVMPHEARQLLDLSSFLPPWFQLFANLKKMLLSYEVCRKMIQSILKGAALDMILRGIAFGYSSEDIAWYVNEVGAAAKRAAHEYGGEPEEFLT